MFVTVAVVFVAVGVTAIAFVIVVLILIRIDQNNIIIALARVVIMYRISGGLIM